MIAAILSAILGLTFASSAVPKLRRPKAFQLAVLAYHVLPSPLADWYAKLVPPLELLCAILLLTGTAVRLAAMVMAVLLLSFIIAVAINMVRGRTLDCHCFGKAARRPIGWPLLFQDCLLLVIAILVVIYTHSWLMTETWSLFGRMGVVAAGSLVPLLIGLMLAVAAVCLARGTAAAHRKLTTSVVKS
ncbi:MAG: MauE/DoxX family redox-associated membrane protein [Chloroflexota bacterium]